MDAVLPQPWCLGACAAAAGNGPICSAPKPAPASPTVTPSATPARTRPLSRPPSRARRARGIVNRLAQEPSWSQRPARLPGTQRPDPGLATTRRRLNRAEFLVPLGWPGRGRSPRASGQPADCGPRRRVPTGPRRPKAHGKVATAAARAPHDRSALEFTLGSAPYVLDPSDGARWLVCDPAVRSCESRTPCTSAKETPKRSRAELLGSD